MHKSKKINLHILFILAFSFIAIVVAIYSQNDKATTNSKISPSTEQYLANKYGLEKPSQLIEVKKEAENWLNGDFGFSFVVEKNEVSGFIAVLLGLMLTLYIIYKLRKREGKLR